MWLTLDIIEVEPESLELCGVVYSIEMAPKSPTLTQRMEAVEAVVGLRPVPGSVRWQSLRKNWLSILALVVSVIGIALANFAPWQPRQVQQREHADKDLGLRIDDQIDKKFTAHHFSEMEAAVNSMNGALGRIEKNVDLLLTKSLKQSTSLSPLEFRYQLPEINQILEALASQNGSVDQVVVRALQDKLQPFVKQDDPQAWEAMLSLASYRSSANGLPVVGEKGGPPRLVGLGESGSDYQVFTPKGEQGPTMSVYSTVSVPKEIAAVAAQIGQDLNPNDTGGHLWIVYTGGAVILDNWHYRNAVFRNVHIVYRGGPVRLENVIFLDCKFSVTPTKPGQSLMAKAIESGTVSLSLN